MLAALFVAGNLAARDFDEKAFMTRLENNSAPEVVQEEALDTEVSWETLEKFFQKISVSADDIATLKSVFEQAREAKASAEAPKPEPEAQAPTPETAVAAVEAAQTQPATTPVQSPTNMREYLRMAGSIPVYKDDSTGDRTGNISTRGKQINAYWVSVPGLNVEIPFEPDGNGNPTNRILQDVDGVGVPNLDVGAGYTPVEITEGQIHVIPAPPVRPADVPELTAREFAQSIVLEQMKKGQRYFGRVPFGRVPAP